MRATANACHIAVPARDLDEAVVFYADGLGARLARRYDDRVTFDFFGDQVVCHLSDEVADAPLPYPHHFGLSFADGADFDRMVNTIHEHSLPVLSDVSVRFDGTPARHRTIFLADPSNNVIEFKHYDDPRQQY
ncbi:MAG TPA: VOC family protein [Candidatus Dormibacteraeota bacterium]|jgi:extradiol dioxygenase family protein|nr:VOC family protein [Candidatus Dormibacteraeota bacterium]